jgi:hypothetical protein
MADAKTRKQRMRQRRQQAGLKAALVWLTPEGQAAMAALRQPGESVDAFFNRALLTLHRLTPAGTSPASYPDTRLSDGAGAALLALLQVLLPAGGRRYLAQSQHLRYETQSSYNLLQSKELQRHHARAQTRGIVRMAVNDS